MSKKLFKYLSIFLGVGIFVGGLTTAFVVSGQKNNGLNQEFILTDPKITPIFGEDKIKNNPQYELQITVSNSNTQYSFELKNVDELKNPTTAGDNKYFKSWIKDGIVTIDVQILEGEQYPEKGEEVEGDPLAPYKRADKSFPILQLKADNVKRPLLIYLVIKLEN